MLKSSHIFSNRVFCRYHIIPALQAREVPPLRQALTTALTPNQDGIAFDLYLELCHFFLKELRRGQQ